MLQSPPRTRNSPRSITSPTRSASLLEYCAIPPGLSIPEPGAASGRTGALNAPARQGPKAVRQPGPEQGRGHARHAGRPQPED